MWNSWKDTFNPLHKNLELETRLARGEDSFGTAAAAQLIHGIDPNKVPAPFRIENPGLPKGVSLAEDFNAYFENLATTDTHSNEIVQGTLDQLYQSSTNLHNKIKKLLAELKSALPLTGGRNNSGGSRGNAPTYSTPKRKPSNTAPCIYKPPSNESGSRADFASTTAMS